MGPCQGRCARNLTDNLVTTTDGCTCLKVLTVHVANGGYEVSASRWRDQALDGRLLDAISERLQGNVTSRARVPFEEVVSTVDSLASAVEPVVGVEGVDGQTLHHPANLHGQVRDGAVRTNPWC